ncbi:MAG: aminotransferase class I/II-fold pyridoxal phosphate-dependent enzyme [Alloprevotella sp.]|nr:aminotransferase class I/II-fold pyridoxal phosphate-dependent enzyme [Alloprevotella sp.]
MKQIQPADRIGRVEEYYFSRKLREVARMNAEGGDVISLAIGSPDMPPSDLTVSTLCAEARHPDAHGYQPTRGTAELRAAMAGFYARHYGVTLDADSEVLPLIGSKEGILHVTLAFVNPGDTVLVPDPGYPTYTSLSQLLGVRVVKYNLRAENGWQPDFDELERLADDRTRILWTNYPHMPTGAPPRRDIYERLVRFAEAHGILVANDNPYSFILTRERLSLLQVPGARRCCIELNSLSKSHNMPGWRVGMLAGSAEHVAWVLRVKSNIDSGTFRPLQLAAAEALTRNTDDWHAEHNYNIYARRRVLAQQVMEALGCVCDPQSVGMFLWGRIPDRYADAEVLTERVLHEARVFITPGFIFGENGRRYVRVSLCAPEERLQQALERIRTQAIWT